MVDRLHKTACTNSRYARLFPKCNSRLEDTETYLRDNCWAMIEGWSWIWPPTRTTPR